MWKLKAHYLYNDPASFYFMGKDGMYGVFRKTGIRYKLARIFGWKLDYIAKL